MTRTGPLRILVLCSGNIGRSPLAASLLEDALAQRLNVPVSELGAAGVSVQSAGTDAPEGHEASKRGVAFAAERGVDLAGHRATQLTSDLVQEADLIYGMDRHQVAGVGNLALVAVAKTLLWEGEGREIPDPHHESDEFFWDVGERIEAALPEVVAEVVTMVAARKGS